LKKTWRSPIYALFKIDQVSVEYHNGRLAHFFPCGARKCKFAAGGIRRYQDTLDKLSTANLKQHAVSCWGQEAVDAVIGGDKAKERSGSVFAAFARKGQQPAHHTHRVHTNDDIRANLVRWLTENNCPTNIINNRALCDLLLAGRPSIDLPSCFTISRDICSSFLKCQDRIGKLLQ
ncbi:hypothetical protein SCLCIDRAFT_53965, partial [Scleroderma citrinum Foug A]